MRRDAVAVVLDLVQPPLVAGRLLDERRERERDGGWSARAAAARARPVFRARPVSCGRAVPRASRAPARRLARGDLVHRAARRDAAVVRAPRVRLTRAGLLVALLDQQPLVLLVVAGPARVHEHPAALQPLAGDPDLELALLQPLVRVADRLPGPGVPEHDGAASVLSLGDGALEVAVLQGVVLHVDGEAADLGVQAGSLGDRPAEQHAVELEPQVVVQAACGVLLDAEQAAGEAFRAGGLGRLPLAPSGSSVFVKSRLRRYVRSSAISPPCAAACPCAPWLHRRSA